jgi:uncharacterized membrane protein
MTTEGIAWIVTIWYVVSLIAMYTFYNKSDTKFGWVKLAVRGLLWPLYVLSFIIGVVGGVFLIPHYLIHKIIENNELIKQLEDEVTRGEQE